MHVMSLKAIEYTKDLPAMILEAGLALLMT